MAEPAALEMRNVTKAFGDTTAVDGVDFRLEKGEIHVLLGENGAGKSTLMNIAGGLYSPNSGELFVGGQPTTFGSTRDAHRCGIGMVHQHFMLIPVFTVAENIVLGEEKRHQILVDRVACRKRVQVLSDNYGMDVDPDAIVGSLPVGLQQQTEILKTLYRQAQILILDEPTAVLTSREIDRLFEMMKKLSESGVSILFVTHKLKEAMAIADRITVIRKGRVVDTLAAESANRDRLAVMMIGREIDLSIDKSPAMPGKETLKARDLTIRDEKGIVAVDRVSFSIRAGEILGIGGVEGNGQMELVQGLTGLCPVDSGDLCIEGRGIPFENPRHLVNAGVAHIPEDRLRHGLVDGYPIADNLVLRTYNRAPYARVSIRRRKVVDEYARRLMEQFGIRGAPIRARTGALSGGNLQKVVLARELSRQICCLIASQPTRGLDVGAVAYIHRQLIGLRDKGVAVLLVSADLDEIMSLSDRIGVMYKGKLTRTVDASTLTRERIGRMMAGLGAANGFSEIGRHE